MRFFVLRFSNDVVVSDTFEGVFEANAFACEYCEKYSCTLVEMLGMQSIDDYMMSEVVE